MRAGAVAVGIGVRVQGRRRIAGGSAADEPAPKRAQLFDVDMIFEYQIFELRFDPACSPS
jgi:hypothetical protein